MSKTVIADPPLLDGRPMTPEEEVRFWRFFYAESQRLFGDKEGPFESLTAKAMRLLKYDAEFFAIYGKAGYEYGLNARKHVEMRKKFDARKRGDWRKRYIPDYLRIAYKIYISPADGDMSKEDAIRQIARDYRFPSYEAAYKELQRIGIKGLPSTWAKD